MTDLGMLERAAKASGIKTEFYENDYGEIESEWNPLHNDGDALRLAVALNIDINEAQRALHDEIGNLEYHRDKYAATRRAIVRAAAEIGKAMK